MDSTRKNYIIAKFEIKKSDIKQETQILNYNENDKSEELKNSCEIYIKDKKIPFSYTYKFEKEGIYTIKYQFNKKIKNGSFMFHFCEKLIEIDLSNFDSSEITNMTAMFNTCTS